MLRWLRTVVVGDEEKARVTGLAGTGKASVREPLMTCRDQEDGIKAGASQWLRDEPGGYPLTGQAVPGVRAA